MAQTVDLILKGATIATPSGIAAGDIAVAGGRIVALGDMAGITAIETRADLIEWAKGHLPGSSVHELEGELIIHTGLTWEMNGELMPIEDIDD